MVDGRADALLDASAGRRSVAGLLARREMRLHHVSGLLALAPIVSAGDRGGTTRGLALVGRF